ncbi:tail fiber protein [Pseudomonas sp. TWI923]|uniref:phage tail protein n=1 Tax=Pseudomonas sp. TWI923 TaxID=3136794 RepID=UPI0032078B32
MDYPKSTPGIGLVDGLFVDENPSTGQPGSLIPAAWANALMAELLGVIKAAGIVPSEEDNAQLLRAIQTMAASDYKKSVRCATTGPIALSGLQTIDGVQLAAGDRVLVKDQAAASQNWIYTVSPNAWVRAQDANESAECAPGHLIPVQAGTVNKLTVWQLTNTETPVVGTTALAFRVVIGKQGTTLADYGIGDAYRKDQTYSQAQVDALLKNVNAMPVGSILPMPKATVPAGFLELDGSEQVIATFPDLAAYLGGAYNKGNEQPGYFRLPDTRGEFLRGWDHTRGVDPDRVIGSSQLGTAVAFDDATGYGVAGWRANTTADDGKPEIFGADRALRSDYPNGNTQLVTSSTSTLVTVGMARPRNIAVMWCIKAWNAPVNQGTIDIGALAVQVSGLEQRQRALGDGQSNQNLSATRLMGTTYTNTTGRTIWLQIAVSMLQGVSSTVTVGSEQRSYIANNGTGGVTGTHSLPVLHGESYSVSGGTLVRWNEVRT